MKRKDKVNRELKELEDQPGIIEIYGRRVFWFRTGRSKKLLYTTHTSGVGTDTAIYDMRANKFLPLKRFKDYRRVSKYYYDWGEIDRLIYKYFYEKTKYRLEKEKYMDVVDMPDHIIDIRNEIIESLFNLVKTIIYTHSFHQQLYDGDLFQDSVEKLIFLLDNDKHNPLRGTSFTFFTIALKNMIFTQIKKNKRYAISIDRVKPSGGMKHTGSKEDFDNIGFEMDMSCPFEDGDAFEKLLSSTSNTMEEEYPYNAELEAEFSDEPVKQKKVKAT